MARDREDHAQDAASQVLARVWQAIVASRAVPAARDSRWYLDKAVEAAHDFASIVSAGQEAPGVEGEFYRGAAESLLAAVALGVATVAPMGQATPAAVLSTLRALTDGQHRSGYLLDGWFATFEDGGARQVVADAYAAARSAAGPSRDIRASVCTTAKIYLRRYNPDAGTAWKPNVAIIEPAQGAVEEIVW